MESLQCKRIWEVIWTTMYHLGTLSVKTFGHFISVPWLRLHTSVNGILLLIASQPGVAKHWL